MGALGTIALDLYESLQARRNPKVREIREARHSAQLEAAKQTRYGDDANSGPGSADDEYEWTGDREEIRDRAHAAYRDIPFAKAIVDTNVDQVVGTGLVPQVIVNHEKRRITANQAEELQEFLEDLFVNWAKRSDVTGRQSFAEQTRTIAANRMIAGDILSMPVTPRRLTRKNEIETRCELIESHRLASPYGPIQKPDTVGGVVLGPKGEPRSYWISNGHPGGLLSTSPEHFKEIPALDRLGRPRILHHYVVKRPGQTRGLSEFHAVLPTLQHHAKYLQAEVIAARMAACIGLLFLTPVDPSGKGDSSNRTIKNLLKMRPGMAPKLPPGTDVKEFSPNRMTASSTVPFAELLQTEAATGVGTSYGTIAKDFRRDNFSNTKAAIQMDRAGFRCQQLWVGQNVCQPYFEVIGFEALLKGMFPEFVPVTNYRQFVSEWCDVEWMPTPGWDWIDSLKDAQTAEKDMEMTVRSATDICRTKGTSYEAVLRKQLKEEKLEMELREEMGLPSMAAVVAEGDPADPDPNDDNPDDNEDSDKRKDESEDNDDA
ncbi:MAG: phage portal protein [Planctomycetota bacterium]